MERVIPESFTDFLLNALNHSERPKELENEWQQIANRERELLSWVEEQSGIERTEKALEEDETVFESLLAPKNEQWTLMLEVIDHYGRGELAKGKLNKIELDKLTSELKQLIGGMQTIRYRKTKEVDAVLEAIHNRHIQTFKALIKQLRQPLRKYRREKLFASLIPKFIYLIFTLIIFAIGASLVGDQFTNVPLKLGFAVVVWGIQEFFVTPFAEKKLREIRHNRLKRLIGRLSLTRIWASALSSEVEYGLNKSLNRRKEINGGSATTEAAT